MSGVFINYRVRDSALSSAAIRDTMARRFGADQVFRDCDSLQVGARYPDGLRAALESADVLVCIVGPQWFDLTDASGVRLIDRERDWVRYEIARALDRGIPIVPVLLPDVVERPGEDNLPDNIRQLAFVQSMSVRQDRFGADLDALLARLVELAPTLVIPRLFTAPPQPRTPGDAPSTLLRAEYGVVPFVGRAAQLADLRAWATGSAACSARLVAGPPGAGKSRLAGSLCAELVAKNWLAGVVHGQAPAADIRHTAGIDKPLLVVVDDVETRVDQLVALATAIGDRSALRDAPARLLLLATAEGDWLRPLRRHPDDRVRSLFGMITERSTVTLTSTESERRAQFDSVRAAFATTMGLPGGDLTSTMVGDESLLDVHAMALTTVLGAAGDTVHHQAPPLARLLRFDRAHLRRQARAEGRGDIDPTRVAVIGTLATLCRPGSADEADALLTRLPDLIGPVDYPLADYVAWLRRLYPGPYAINPIQPDALGAQLVAATLAAQPSIATVLAANATVDQIATAMTALGRALRRHPGVASALVDIVRVAPEHNAALGLEVAGRLADPEPFVRVLSTAIDGITLDVDGIEELVGRVKGMGLSGGALRASVLRKFVDEFTKPIRDHAIRTGADDRFTDMVMNTALVALDPAQGASLKHADGQDIISPDLLNALRRLLIDGDRS